MVNPSDPSAQDESVITPAIEDISSPDRVDARKRLIDWLAVAGAMSIYLIVQIMKLQGPHPFDPARYFRLALEYPDLGANLFSLRIGLIASVRLAVASFGESEVALYAVPLFMGLLLVSSVFGIVMIMFRSRWLAFAAGLIAAMNPYFFINSSHIFPDNMAAATFTAGFFLLVLAASQDAAGRSSKMTMTIVGLAGVVFGMTCLIREFSVLLFPLVAAAALMLRFPWRHNVVLALSTGGALLLNPLYGWLKYADPLIHLRRLLGRNYSGIREGRLEAIRNVQDQIDNPIEAVLVFPRLLLSFDVGWLFLSLIIVFVVALLVVRDRRLWIIATWCFGFWAFMAAISIGRLPSGRWILNTTNIRYWYPILPAVAIGALGGLHLLATRLSGIRRRSGYAVAGVLLVALVTVTLGMTEYSRCEEVDVWRAPPRQRWLDLREWVGTSQAQRFTTIATDRWTQQTLPLYLRTALGEPLWKGDVETISDPEAGLIEETADPQRTVLVLHKPYFRRLAGQNASLSKASWAPIAASTDREMVVLLSSSATETNSDIHPTDAGEWWDLRVDREAAARNFAACGGNPYDRLARTEQD